MLSPLSWGEALLLSDHSLPILGVYNPLGSSRFTLCPAPLHNPHSSRGGGLGPPQLPLKQRHTEDVFYAVRKFFPHPTTSSPAFCPLHRVPLGQPQPPPTTPKVQTCWLLWKDCSGQGQKGDQQECHQDSLAKRDGNRGQGGNCAGKKNKLFQKFSRSAPLGRHHWLL